MPTLKGTQVRGQAQLILRLTYPPNGTIFSEGLRDTRIQQVDTVQPATLAFGTGSTTFDLACINDKSIPPSSSLTLDLYTGTDLLGQQGETCAFREIRLVWISVLSGGESGVRIGGAAANEFKGWLVSAGDQADIYAGGPPFWQGNPVTAKVVTTAAKNLQVQNLSTTTAAVIRVAVAGSRTAAGESVGWLWLWTSP